MYNSWLRCSKSVKASQGGMTLLELLIAVLMLMTFTSVVVMVMEFSLRFLGDIDLTEEEMNDPDANANGVLIDHAEARYSMDKLVQVLSQPRVSKAELTNIFSGANRCSSNPITDWSLPAMLKIDPMSMPKVYSPPLGYEFCLSSILHSSGNTDIYMLQALPKDPPDLSRLPVRRLFCRPRPFC